MTTPDIPLPQPGDTNWSDWGAETEDLTDQVRILVEQIANGGVGGGLTEEPPPTGFDFAHLTLPTVLRTGDARFRALLDIESLRPPVGTAYHVAPSATAGNPGTEQSPMRLNEALARSDVGTIYFAPGEYDRSIHFTSLITDKSINFIAKAPGVRVTGWNPNNELSWSLVSGSVFSTSRSATTQVVDVYNLTPWGDYTVYTKKTGLASVTGPGQWAASGSTVYVWPIGGTDLTLAAGREQIRLGVTARTGVVAGAGTHYVRGIDFEGCNDGGAHAYGTATIIAEDCTFKYSLGPGGVQTVGGHGYIAIRCEASSNAADGFNYHGSGGVNPDVIEIDCTAHHNGLANPGTNNGSTLHEAIRGLRIGGDYDVSAGPVVADVNSSRSWNLGCRSGRSTVAGGASWRVDATGFEGDPAQVHLVACIAAGDVPYGVTGGGVLSVDRSWPAYTP